MSYRLMRAACARSSIRIYKSAASCLIRLASSTASCFAGGVNSTETDRDQDAMMRKGKTKLVPVEDDTRDLLVIQPDQKYGLEWPIVGAQFKLEEAVKLAESISGWEVLHTRVEALRKPHNRHLFGKGKIAELREYVKSLAVSSVFINYPVLSSLQHNTLQEIFDKEVFDRFGIILKIFKERANTQQAKVQVELAEIPYIKARLPGVVDTKQQGRGVAGKMAGGGVTTLQLQQQELVRREKSLRQKLDQIRAKQNVNRAVRSRQALPVVAVVGYTNAGKTTLIKTLTRDGSMEPKDLLFATLDSTVHAGQLSNGLKVLYVDTIGFISDLPHELVDSFASTLEDVRQADLLTHVRDASHPQTLAQRENVLKVLKKLDLRPALLESMIEVLNKSDLVEQHNGVASNGHSSISVSAKYEHNLDNLRKSIEEAVVCSTGLEKYRIVVPIDGGQLSWLHREGTVQSATPLSTESQQQQLLEVCVLMSRPSKDKFKANFRDIVTKI